nr:MAG TPA: hypothetical protein [Caudoviricetes sp.]
MLRRIRLYFISFNSFTRLAIFDSLTRSTNSPNPTPTIKE